MPVPDYESVMLPLLQLLGDQRDHARAEVIETLACRFQLTDDERNQVLPTGHQRVFENRVGWARTYLKKAGLIEYPERAVYRVTRRGREVLRSNPPTIDRRFLEQFPEFLEFVRSRPDTNGHGDDGDGPRLTPEETLEASYQSLRAALAEELLDRIKRCSPRFFEQLVVDLLVAMGYGGSRKDAGQAVGQSGDGGIDGTIKEDKLGLDVIHLQAKRWDRPVGRPDVQAFAGSLMGLGARKGVFITTSRFTQEAVDFVRTVDRKIVLIDGQQLAQRMIDHGVGVNEVSTYTVKKVDVDYFGEE